MTLPVWQPGTLYNPGAMVVPSSAGAIQSGDPANASFESGATGWTLPSGFIIDQTIQPVFDGPSLYMLRFANTVTGLEALNDDIKAINPGATITATCRIVLTSNDPSSDLGGAVILKWLDASNNVLQTDIGNAVYSTTNGRDVFFLSSVTGTAPVNATQVQLGARGTRTHGTAYVGYDAFHWDWTYSPPDAAGVAYKATQANAGFSGASEPTWPGVGNFVTDNQVTWEGVEVNLVTWQASPILKTGTIQPTWPTTVGGQIADGTMAWEAITGQITDPKCPHSKIVAIIASKVFAGDSDIVAYSATVNPLDWSTPNDAGYIPFGLNTHGSTPCTALGLYRSNLVIFNDEGYQMWQVDEDPANNAILDASPVDCPFARSVQSVSNDLIFLSARGVRSIGIAGASTNLQAGFFGAAIDPLIIEAIASLPADEIPISIFWSGAGQYWLIFGAEAFVLTMNGATKDQSWSRYVFPAEITDWAILDTQLYLRAGELVWRVSNDAKLDDEFLETGQGGDNVPFYGVIQWPYLDFGKLGNDKQLEGFDLVITGEVNVQFGYSQTNFALVTDPYILQGDTLPGDMVPMPLTGPTFQMRLTFSPNQNWEWMMANLYVNDL